MSAGDDKLIYIAAPYQHDNMRIRNARVGMASTYAAYLVDQGEPVFSPLSHSAEIEFYRNTFEIPNRWYDIDLQILKVCTEMHVLKLGGWKESKGVRYELEQAKSQDIPVYMIEAYLDNTFSEPVPW